MIIGIGTDIVDMRRIQALWDKHGQRFLDRVYTPYEQSYCLKKSTKVARFAQDTSAAANSLAKIFAAKEAVVKAIGDTTGIGWHDIEVRHESTGRPCIVLHRNAHKNLIKIMGHADDSAELVYKIHLSLSDEPPYAMSYVVLDSF